MMDKETEIAVEIEEEKNSLTKNTNPCENPEKMQPSKTDVEGNKKICETPVSQAYEERSQQSTKIVDQTIINQKPRETSEYQNEKCGALSAFSGGLQHVTPTKSAKIPEKVCTIEEKDNLRTPSAGEVVGPLGTNLDIKEAEGPKKSIDKKIADDTKLLCEATTDDGVNKHKTNESPTSMQTLLIPKITETQGQDKSHSAEGVRKHEKQLSKLSSDVTKTLSDTKKSLKPTKGKVG
jgi:hypothetical protein